MTKEVIPPYDAEDPPAPQTLAYVRKYHRANLPQVPFDANRARAGDPVQTTDGRGVDLQWFESANAFVGFVHDEEFPYKFGSTGTHQSHLLILCMVPPEPRVMYGVPEDGNLVCFSDLAEAEKYAVSQDVLLSTVQHVEVKVCK